MPGTITSIDASSENWRRLPHKAEKRSSSKAAAFVVLNTKSRVLIRREHGIFDSLVGFIGRIERHVDGHVDGAGGFALGGDVFGND